MATIKKRTGCTRQANRSFTATVKQVIPSGVKRTNAKYLIHRIMVDGVETGGNAYNHYFTLKCNAFTSKNCPEVGDRVLLEYRESQAHDGDAFSNIATAKIVAYAED